MRDPKRKAILGKVSKSYSTSAGTTLTATTVACVGTLKIKLLSINLSCSRTEGMRHLRNDEKIKRDNKLGYMDALCNMTEINIDRIGSESKEISTVF